MAKIQPGTLHDFITGETVTEQVLDTVFEILRVAINDTDARVDNHKAAAVLDHPDGSVTTAKIADSAVTAAKIADGSITASKIASGALNGITYDKATIDLKINNATFTATVAAGTEFPSGPFNLGQVFYRLDENQLYVWHDGWKPVKTDLTSILEEIRRMQRELAHLEAYASIDQRATPNSGKFYDLFDGSGNTYSVGVMDTTKTKLTEAVSAGTAVLTGKVESNDGFRVGQEVTVQDDENMERVIVTRAESIMEYQTIDHSAPVTVVNQAYRLAGNGGRKLVRLSNGWLVAAVYDPTAFTLYFYASQDNGQSWNRLCFMDFASSVVSFALASKDTKVYALFRVGVTTVYSISFDAVTVSDVDIGGNKVSVDTGQSAIDTVSLAIAPDGTLHAAWASKNSTYPNSFNIRYAKGTINGDGTVTWGPVEQVGIAINTSGADMKNPSIIVKPDGLPLIVWEYSSTTNFIKVNYKIDPTTWANAGQGLTIYNGGSYAQSNPCAVVDNAGVIHVVWHGKDATDSTVDNIRYSKSTDGGATWSAATKLTSGNTTNMRFPSITVNKDKKLFVLFTENVSSVSGVSNDGSGWSSKTTYFSTPPTADYSYPSTLYEPALAFSEPLFVYLDTGANAIKFRGVWADGFTVEHLEITPLQNNYKEKAWVYRSLGQVDLSDKKLKFSAGFDSVGIVDHSTPVTVVNQLYDTSGNGGRKLVRLSNGWLVAVAVDTAGGFTYFYKSTDNGSTWTLLAYTDRALYGVAIAARNTTVYAFGVSSSSSGNDTVGTYFVKFDAVSVSNSAALPHNYGLIDNQKQYGLSCALAIAPDGTLHAAWASKSSTYPNSFNIRYSKSTDDGQTWAAPTQVTANNTTGTDNKNPCVVIDSNDFPVIFYDLYTGSTYYIKARTTTDGTTFTARDVYAGGTYAQSSPCAVVDNAGVIHVVWHGMDATDSSINNIRYSKSTDGGATWSAATKLTSGNSYNQTTPSIAVNKYNHLFVVFTGIDPAYATNSYNVRQMKFDGSSWSTPTAITTYTSGISVGSTVGPSTLYDRSLDFTEALVIFKDPVASAVKFRGTWTTGTVAPFLMEDVRYNIMPSHGSTDEVVAWVRREADAEFSIDGAVSIVGAAENESYVAATKTSAPLSDTLHEDEFYYSTATPQEKVTLRLTLNRANASVDKSVKMLTGYLGVV